MNKLRGKVAVTGVGYSRLSRNSQQTLGEDTVDACLKAVEDAGLTLTQVDGLSTAPRQPFANAGSRDGVDMVTPRYLASALGLNNIDWYNNDGGQIGSSLIAAIEAVAARECTSVLVWRGLSFPRNQRYSFVDPATARNEMQFWVPYGFTDAGAPYYSHLYRRYMERYGATREHMAHFVVNNRTNALMNERGYWFNERPELLSEEDYLNSRMISEPYCIHDCDLPIQGCAAYLVTSADRAKQAPHNPAYLVGYGDGSHPSTKQGPLEEFQLFAGSIGKALWQSTGMGPDDIDTANLYDGFSFVVYLYLEALGFCGEGEAFEFVQGSRTSLKGSLPLNTSGGNLGEGRLHGAAHITEAVLQAQGRAGVRQVPDAHLTLATAGIRSWGQAFVFSHEPL